MVINKVNLIYFSPTGTSKRVSEAIVEGTEIKELAVLDITLHPLNEDVLFSATNLAVIAVPVYGGHVPPIAVERLQHIQGQNTPVLIVVVYGNRAYEKALVELDQLVTSRGFKVIAGGTFIGEHSFSTEAHPIAKGRPDLSDLNLAVDFGKRVADKIASASDIETLYGIDVRRIKRPNQPFWPLFRFARKLMKLRKSGVPFPQTPYLKNEKACTQCALCVASCPTGAITLNATGGMSVDPEKCIKCCACVRACKRKGFVYETPLAQLLSDYFKKQKEPQTLL